MTFVTFSRYDNGIVCVQYVPFLFIPLFYCSSAPTASLLLVPTFPQIVSLHACMSPSLTVGVSALPRSPFFCFSDPTCILTYVQRLCTYTWVQLDTVMFIGLIFRLFVCFWHFGIALLALSSLNFAENTHKLSSYISSKPKRGNEFLPCFLLSFISSSPYCL